MQHLSTFLMFLIMVTILSYNNNLSAQPASKGIKFKVCDVELAQELLSEVSYKNAILEATHSNLTRKYPSAQASLIGDYDSSLLRVLEAYPDRTYSLVPAQNHAFLQATALSYAEHRPLVISPDMVWLMILQGFAAHVDQNSEELRHHFVDFEGKKVLHLFVGPSFKWEEVLADFKTEIGKYTGEEVTDLASQEFSTTTIVEQTAFNVSMMDAMSSYFRYFVTVLCGVPEITLEGTPEDWQKIEKATQQLAQYDLKWWTDELASVLQQFTAAAKGDIDTDFWAGIYNEEHVPVGCTRETQITGWVNKFFPYMNGDKNPLVTGKLPNPNFKGFEISDYPTGLGKADVMINDEGFKMKEVTAGFIGIQQDKKTKALRPEISWAAIDTGMPPSKEDLEAYKKDIEEKMSVQKN